MAKDVQRHKQLSLFIQSNQSSNAVSLKLTFAGLHALRPPVINVSVVDSSAVLEPSTARSATTGSAGFLECTALWAGQRISDRQGEGWRAD